MNKSTDLLHKNDENQGEKTNKDTDLNDIKGD